MSQALTVDTSNILRVLVINSGSSSIKFSLFDCAPGRNEPRHTLDGDLTGIGGEAVLELRAPDRTDLSGKLSNIKANTPKEAIHAVLDAVEKARTAPINAVGYRVVHPGAKLNEHHLVTDEVLRDLEEAAVFAPLHDPEVITIIRESMARFPNISHYACFDTVFHETMPEEATTYPLPSAYREQGARRYGFHGLSCESVVRQLQKRSRDEDLGFPQRMVIAHLGSGCSVTALLDGRSVDTTMGLTPTGGIVMATRPGDLDPGLVLYMLRQQAGDVKAASAAVEKILNELSGIEGLSGMAGGVKDVCEAAENGDVRAALAMKVFTRSVKKAIGGFSWLLGGLDAIVFTGGVGEHDAFTRSEILSGVDGLGAALDARPNGAKSPALRRVGAATAAVTTYVVPSQENLMIAIHVKQMFRSKQ